MLALKDGVLALGEEVLGRPVLAGLGGPALVGGLTVAPVALVGGGGLALTESPAALRPLLGELPATGETE